MFLKKWEFPFGDWKPIFLLLYSKRGKWGAAAVWFPWETPFGGFSNVFEFEFVSRQTSKNEPSPRVCCRGISGLISRADSTGSFERYSRALPEPSRW